MGRQPLNGVASVYNGRSKFDTIEGFYLPVTKPQVMDSATELRMENEEPSKIP
jgi:hypothetical protein